MASSSSSTLSRTWRYSVFASFHGKDVRKTFLSHLRKQFNYNGISMFDDEGIERSKTLPVALKEAIRESRISIVVLSKKYASSSWCLKELVEILKCKEDMGQIVMTVFHGVDPSDVRNQTGKFGIAFDETCARNTEEERRSWSQALTHVGNIAGEHFQNCVNEAEMIEKIAKDVLDKRKVTPSRDFDGMVGLDAHLRKMESLLDLNSDGRKVVAITGPAGIGKTTIARALLNLLSDRFQLTCFVDSLRGSYQHGFESFDDYGSKLHLQEQFLSKVLNHDRMRIRHLGAIKENLGDQKVLIILDDVNHLNQLEALANATTWFGPGSRIVVTTENKELLQQHGIDSPYHVGFPSIEEAREILCSYAFKQSSPVQYGFQKFFGRITELCGDLPLALRVVGSSLSGKKEDEWEDVVNRLETILDPGIGNVLRFGYESLDENEQTLFLHIAIFFNHEYGDHVKAMFADDYLDVKRGLNILVYRSLIEMRPDGGRVVMHRLLQQIARQVIRKQELSKRQILMDTHEICDVLENETGTGAVSGILFDISGIRDIYISKRALRRMPNLRFLRVYKSRDDGNDVMHIPAEMEFPRCLRLLHWEAYSSKCLPPTFHPEYLVKICMQDSRLEYLWQGTQKLTNLKKMDLSRSFHLKVVPDLSNATNLEELNLSHCESLIEIPSSFSHLQKLRELKMNDCINLQVTPPYLKLASLEVIYLNGCLKLRNFPFVSTNFREVDMSYTQIEDVPALVRLWPRLETLKIGKCGNIKGLTYLPTSVTYLNLSYSDIERIPDCIKALHRLSFLILIGCKRLTSLTELPGSLAYLCANDCVSLETVSFLFAHNPHTSLYFANCFKLGQQARREMIKRSFSRGWASLPGSKVPAKFNYRARGNSVTIPLDGNNSLSALSKLKLGVVMSPHHKIGKYSRGGHNLLCRRISKGGDSEPKSTVAYLGVVSSYQAQHLFICDYELEFIDPSEVSREKIVLEFSCGKFGFSLDECGCMDIIECGAYIWTEETIQESFPLELDQVFEGNHGILSNENYEIELNEAFEDPTQLSLMGARSLDGDSTNGVTCEPQEEENLKGKGHTNCWSWFFLCFNLSDFVRNIGSLVSGRRR